MNFIMAYVIAVSLFLINGENIPDERSIVGNVSEIKINPNNSEEIQLDILIKKGTPIKQDNYAILGNLGITGLKYIELKGGTHDSLLLEENEEGIKVIESRTSDLVSLLDSTQDITQELMQVLNQVKKVLNDKNIESFSNILSKSENSASNIEQLSQYLVNNEVKIMVQVNGKIRGEFTATSGVTQEEAFNLALKDANVKKHVNSKEPKKVIYIPNKILNIVI